MTTIVSENNVTYIVAPSLQGPPGSGPGSDPNSVETLTNKTLDDYTNNIHADAVHRHVKNSSGAIIFAGTALAFSGYNVGEDAIEVIPCDQSTMIAIGIAEEDIAIGGFGLMILSGVLNDVDTSAYTAGQILYVNGSGELTAAEPTTGYAQPIAYVLSAKNNGSIQILAAYPKQNAADVRYDATSSVADYIEQAINALGTGGSVGSVKTYFLNQAEALADNYTLSAQPTGLPETIITVSADADINGGITFIERYISPAIGGTQIDGGVWRFNIFASTNSSVGVSEIISRINERTELTGITVTFTGTGATRTLTATGGSPFLPEHATSSILTAALVETPTQTCWISGYTSATQVIVTLTDDTFINVTDTPLNALYLLLFSTTTGDINSTEPLLYTTTSVQPAYTISPTDRIVLALFAKTSSTQEKDISLYLDGESHYSHIETPLKLRHNDSAGLNEGDYQHLTLVEKATMLTSISTIPTTNSDTGTTGQVAWDSDYIYICTATDTWKRIAVTPW